MTRFVIDSSITMSWCFEDEKTTYSESILEALAAGAKAVVPSLWSYEVLNVLVGAQRRKRITQAQAQALRFWRELQAFSISDDKNQSEHSSLEILALAEQHRLTAYDAAYLELSLREGLPLATLDGDLKKAAKLAGIPIAHSA